MSLNAAFVLTTIFDPAVLEDYFANIKRHGHLDEVQVFLIPDRKTPASAYKRCEELQKRGLRLVCPSFDEQESFLQRVGLPPAMIPYNSDNRRNVGYLMALDSDAEFIISIDDDNYCQPDEDFVSEHAVVCKGPASAKVIKSDTGWLNICDQLKFDHPGPVYPRGFPYYARHKPIKTQSAELPVEIHMNAGLWLSDPDVDGISWMVNPVRGTEFSGNSLVLDAHTWSPVNTQNTGLRRDVVAGYYFIRMGCPLGGIPIDRYGDIFSGYFAQACMRHLKGAVRVGTPIAVHRRNSHNYVKDAMNEWACIVVLEDLLPWLTEQARLSGNSYSDAYESLSDELESATGKFKGPIWTDATRSYFREVADSMRKWAGACRRLGAQTNYALQDTELSGRK